MLRIRTGARHGLRGGMFGFVAALFTISGGPSHAAPYADIVVDANSGTVLHSTNPDAQRHPASLTKIMTLYLLFEQLEAGKLKLDSPLPVSKEAAGQMPTKLGLKPGSTLAVEDAIKGMVTRSANDAAVVVAEAIAGDEDAFAKLMTRKAQALGMSRTIYKNASGLPDSGQITTARDQSTLGRAVQERFPRYYKYFSIRTFVFRGQSIGNHNNLLGRVEGVDGIKTGYVNASGFNLVTSVHRGNRYLVAVVMGGSSAGSRDAKMRDLISDKIAQASVKRTAPMVAEGSPPPEARPEPKAVAKVETAPEPKVAAKVEAKPEPKVAAKTEANKTEAKPEPKAEARFAVASAVSLPVRLNSAPASADRSRHHQNGIDGGRGATAHRCRLDRSDPASTGEDAVGEGGNDRVARPDAGIRADPGRTCAGSRGRAGGGARARRRGQAGAAGTATRSRRRSRGQAGAGTCAVPAADCGQDRGAAPGSGDGQQAGRARARTVLCADCREGGAGGSAGRGAGTGRGGRARPCPRARISAGGEAAASQRLDHPGRRLSGRAGGQKASRIRADEGGQAAHQGRSVHRNGREGWHHSLPRALCRSRQGLGRSRLQASQAQRRRMRHRQELTSSVKQDSRVARSRPMRRVKEFSDGGAKARPWLRSREPQDTSTPLDRDAVSS